ncbi:MAG: hypothetical protein ACRD8U_00625 [Pyrinomonadaceae bacterium]
MSTETEAGEEATDRFWQAALSELDMEGGQLLRKSQYDRGRRTYLKSGRVYKIVCNRIEQSQTARAKSLEEEFSVLRKLQGVDGVPRNPRYCCKSSAQCLSYDYMEGHNLSEAELTFAQKLFVLARLAAIVTRLSMRGVVHNDLPDT